LAMMRWATSVSCGPTVISVIGRPSTSTQLQPYRRSAAAFQSLTVPPTSVPMKDYIAWPLLSGPSALPALLGNLTANVARNVWTHTIIFCGHFPDGAETFDFDESQ